MLSNRLSMPGSASLDIFYVFVCVTQYFNLIPLVHFEVLEFYSASYRSSTLEDIKWIGLT